MGPFASASVALALLRWMGRVPGGTEGWIMSRLVKGRPRASARGPDAPVAGFGGVSAERWYRLGSIAVVLALTATATYLALALVSYVNYPGVFSPWNNNWLSDLGSRELNPQGAAFYRVGCALNGVLMIAMFLAVTPWRLQAGRRQRVLVGWAQLFGISAAVALIMTAVYPLDLFATHQLWSRILVSAFSGLLFVSFFAFRSAGRSNVPIAVAAVVGYASAVTWLLFGSAHWIEWILVADVLLLVCLVGVRTTRLCQERRQRLDTA